MATAQQPLQFQEDKTFRILVVGDLHEKYIADEKTEDCLRLLNKSAEELKPDLAILMGDIVSGHFKDENGERQVVSIEQMREEVHRVVQPFASRGIPLALVFGNHDGENSRPKTEILSLFAEYDNFRNLDTPGLTGCGNCNLLIRSADGSRDAFNLWLVDSGNRAPEGRGKYAYVESDRIAWYETVAEALKRSNGGVPLPAMAFQHIPVMEEYRLLKKVSRFHPQSVRGNGDLSKNFYIIADKKRTKGYLGEGPCTPDYNSGQFESWKKQGDVLAAFFGHDHMNDFVGTVDGIVLAQNKCAGFHIYGDGLRQGVRLITLHEDAPRSFESTMHRYRDFFGTDCKSIKGIDLFSDRVRQNGKVVVALLGVAVLGQAIKLIVKFLV